MRFSRSFSFVLVFAAGTAAGIVACGSSSKTSVDAKILTNTDAPVSTIDAFVPAPDAAPTPIGCDYGEQMDTNNDNNFGNATGTAETTGLTFGSATLTVCGDINAGHYDAPDMVVDYDAYDITVGTAGNAILTFEAPGAAALDFVNIQIYDSSGNFVAEADFLGDHGVASMALAADVFEFDVTAFNSTATTTSTHYKFQLATDNPTTRCPTPGSPIYTEANDGANNVGNDVIDIPDAGSGSLGTAVLTTATTDAPDNTTIVQVGAGSNALFSGSAGTATPYASSAYLDRDTYQISTGSTTNQLAIRLTWNFTQQDDFDWFLFDTSGNIVGSSDEASTTESEFATIAVLPNTTYWLWQGLYEGSTPVDVAYTTTVCGENFTAP